MPTDITCLQCGKAYDPDVVENRFAGVCPACLAGFARGETDSVVPSPGAADPTVRPPLKIGGTFHGLEVVELLGAGGMGVVYKARHPGLDRFVALKILSPKLASEPEFAARFNREARALAALSHPNIVQVYDVGREADLYFLTMEYVDGASLRDLMKSRRLTPEEAMKLVPQICEALEYAHAEGIVHRDIKPENLLLDRRGRVKIADFGLAKLVGRDTSASVSTMTNVVMGTPGYMAPEQVMSMKVDHRADIYSLGAVFYEMLTGEVPLGRFDPPSRKVQLDVRLDEIVLRALEKEPGRRYQRASEFSTGVRTVALDPRTPPPPPPPEEPKRPIPELVWLALIFVAASYLMPVIRIRGPFEDLPFNWTDTLPLNAVFSIGAVLCALAAIHKIEKNHPKYGGRGLALLTIFLSFPPAGVFGGFIAWLVLAARDRRRRDPQAAGAPTAVIVLLTLGLLLAVGCGGCIFLTRAGSVVGAFAQESLGRASGAEEHDSVCMELTAVEDIDNDHYAAKALNEIASRPALTPHEQMHLVDTTFEAVSNDYSQAGILQKLARHPEFAPEARRYLRESLRFLSNRHFRDQVRQALEEPAPALR